jgi:hypothetical protein
VLPNPFKNSEAIAIFLYHLPSIYSDNSGSSHIYDVDVDGMKKQEIRRSWNVQPTSCNV